LAIELSSPDFEVDRLDLKDPEIVRIYEKIVELEKRLVNRGSALPGQNEGQLPGAQESINYQPRMGKAGQRPLRRIPKESSKTHSEGIIEDNVSPLECHFLEKWPLIIKDEETLKKEESLQLIREAVRSFLSSEFTLNFTVLDFSPKPQLHDMVTRAMNLFDGEVVEEGL